MVSLEQGQGPNCGAPAVPSAFMKRPKIGYWPESGRFAVQVTSARPSGSAITLVSDSLPGDFRIDDEVRRDRCAVCVEDAAADVI
jgi:hypothetical protein